MFAVKAVSGSKVGRRDVHRSIGKETVKILELDSLNSLYIGRSGNRKIRTLSSRILHRDVKDRGQTHNSMMVCFAYQYLSKVSETTFLSGQGLIYLV